LLVAVPFLVALGIAHAQDATWDTNPGSSDWNTNTKWVPQTVPTGTAIFGSSTTTSITFSANGGTGSIGEILFNAGAPAYSFSFTGAFQAVTITSVGIVNNSSNVSTFSTAGSGTLVFQNASAAGNATITNNGSGLTRFDSTSTAGNARITNNNGGQTNFFGASTADNATITNNNIRSTQFLGTSTAGNATVMNNNGGGTVFRATSTGGKTSFVIHRRNGLAWGLSDRMMSS
jgi:fibronectin-binding autotransporter adhesin